jgi:hypothetical protein
MNPNNSATLEAAQRLVDAGIVLETDFYHVHNKLRNVWSIRPLTLDIQEHPEWWEWYPAPSMAEVWRELPESVKWNDMWHHLTVEKLGDETSCYYRTNGKVSNNTSPTDALIDLLIWEKGQKKG